MCMFPFWSYRASVSSYRADSLPGGERSDFGAVRARVGLHPPAFQPGSGRRRGEGDCREVEETAVLGLKKDRDSNIQGCLGCVDFSGSDLRLDASAPSQRPLNRLYKPPRRSLWFGLQSFSRLATIPEA